MNEVTIDWSSAVVRDGTLEVELDDGPPRGWKRSFDRTLGLLHGDWDKIELKKGRLRVQDVGEGDEGRLRHFLESAVAQANATHERRETGARRDRGAGAAEPEGADAEMTDRFRSFAVGSPDQS